MKFNWMLTATLSGLVMLAGCSTAPSSKPSTDAATSITPTTEARPVGRSDLAGYWRVPLTLTGNGLCLVEAVCRGEPLVFILDTGASGTVIDQGTAVRLGARESVLESKNIGIAKTVVSVRELEPLEMFLGSGSIRVRATRQDFMHIRINHKGRGIRQIDGLLGLDVMRAHRAVVDLREPALYLKPIGD
jgi:hypothetical protein